MNNNYEDAGPHQSPEAWTERALVYVLENYLSLLVREGMKISGGRANPEALRRELTLRFDLYEPVSHK